MLRIHLIEISLVSQQQVCELFNLHLVNLLLMLETILQQLFLADLHLQLLELLLRRLQIPPRLREELVE